MNWNKILNLMKKDLLEVRQSKMAVVPMLVLPLLFVVLLPLGFILLPKILPPSQILTNDPDLALFLNKMPAAFQAPLQGLDSYQQMVVIALGYIFAPFFLIFPLMFSVIIAAESFAGERERKTMEALLYTPTSDRELFIGKVLAAFVPAILITWGSFFLYTLVITLASYASFGRIWFPLPTWWPLIFWISPAFALIGTSFSVLISAKAKTFMDAYQSGGSLVVLALGLCIGQVTGVLYLTVLVGMLVGLAAWVIALVLTALAIKGFNRQKLLASIQA